MDVESDGISVDLSQPNLLDQINNGSPSNHYTMPSVCTLCQMMPSTDSFSYVNNGTVGVCGHCKFLLLEDLGTPDDLHLRRLRRGRRSMRSTSESTGELFSQQFSHIMNLARHNQSLISEHHDPSRDSDAISRLFEQTSSRSTPDGSRRWRRMSDTESDGFDNLDSLCWETESNDSFDARIFQGDSDTVSVSVYGGDSIVSMEDHNYLEMETFAHTTERRDVDSDSDIDPMHAGLITWESDGHDDIEEGYGSEEAEVEENAVELLGGRFPSETGVGSSSGSPVHNRRNQSLAMEHRNRLGIMERRYRSISSLFSDLDESGDATYHGNNRGLENIRGFDELLVHLTENDNPRRGAPPAAESFVNSLPRLVINENQKKSDEVACAICKDMLLIGNEAIQLPCLHLYHPCCILPWLGRRNSCPLCRYELPTDDMDYEDEKHNANASSGNPMDIYEIQQQDSSSDISDPIEMVEAEIEISQELGNLSNAMNERQANVERGRWSFLAAAPIVSLLGLVCVLWLGKPLRVTMQSKFHDPSQNSSCRAENQQKGRKWWRWF